MNTKNIPVFQSTTLISNGICRLCGRHNLNVIDVYSGEGLQNDISNKIEMHIPIKLLDSKVPPQCCLECISTILSWHNYVLTVLENNKNISSLTNSISTPISYHSDTEKRIEHIPEVPIYSKEEKDFKGDLNEVEEEIEYSETNINASCEKTSEEDATEAINVISRKDDVPFNIESKENLQSNKSNRQRRKKCEVENKYFCELCDKAFTRKFDMERHKKLKHHEITPQNLDSKKFNKEIIDKCRILENGKTIYECHICQLRTNQSYNLIRHISIHTGVKPYVCHICGKSFRLDSSFRKHINQFHEGVKNYKCEICDKNFGAKSARDEHMNTHSGFRPFTCDICQKSFKQKSSLYVHKLYHDENLKFECAFCDKKFRRAQELVLHDRLHTGHKPYSCDVCGSKFRRNQELKKHKKIHSRNDVEWVCQICESSFTQERYLKLHKKVHSRKDQ